MATDVNGFLLSLASAIATIAALHVRTGITDATKASMWIHDVSEQHATATHTTLRIYGGDEPGHFSNMRTPAVLVQADTRGPDASLVMDQAWKVHEALLDDEGRLRMHWRLPGKAIAASGSIEDASDWWAWVRAVTTVPGLVGRDDRSVWMATGNFEVEFERVS